MPGVLDFEISDTVRDGMPGVLDFEESDTVQDGMPGVLDFEESGTVQEGMSGHVLVKGLVAVEGDLAQSGSSRGRFCRERLQPLRVLERRFRAHRGMASNSPDPH
eukprot:1161717-Pelagomonas_calceolata.AAC.1